MSTALITLLELATTVLAVVACAFQVYAVTVPTDISWAADDAPHAIAATMAA